MKTPTTRIERAAGALILAGLALWATVLVARGKVKGWFHEEARLGVVLDEAHGLSTDAVVRMRGVPVGWVEAVRLLDDDRVEVDLEILHEHEGRLREGLTALVQLPPLLGRTEIHLTPGPVDAPPLRQRTVPVTVSRDSMETLVAVSEKISQLAADLQGITASIRQGEGTLGALITDGGEIHRNIVDVTAQSKELIARVQELAGGLQDSVADVRGVLEQVSQKMSKVDVLLDDLTSVSGRLDEVVETVSERQKGIPAIVESLDATLADVNGMMARLKDELPATVESARQATDEANRLIQAAQRNFLIRSNLEPKHAAQRTVGGTRRHDPYEEP